MNARFGKQKRNVWLTGIARISNLRHALTIESTWREAATTALEFVKRSANQLKIGRSEPCHA